MLRREHPQGNQNKDHPFIVLTLIQYLGNFVDCSPVFGFEDALADGREPGRRLVYAGQGRHGGRRHHGGDQPARQRLASRGQGDGAGRPTRSYQATVMWISAVQRVVCIARHLTGPQEGQGKGADGPADR